jgi:hypothetical protein
MVRYKEYNWLHIPSGEEGKARFDPPQKQFGIRLHLTPEECEQGVEELTALRIINDWNTTGSNWKYWIGSQYA